MYVARGLFVLAPVIYIYDTNTRQGGNDCTAVNIINITLCRTGVPHTCKIKNKLSKMD